MLDFFIRPTPPQFIALFFCYTVISLVLTYVVSGFNGIFIALFVLNIYVFFHSFLFYIETVLSSEQIKVNWEIAIITVPIVAIFMGIFLSTIDDKVKIYKLAPNKNELFEISGVVPNGASIKTSMKGKNRVFLRIGNAMFYCSETIDDACEKIYQYRGKNATIYYQPILYNDDNLVYEIVVHDKADIKVYDFDSQLQKFQDKRKKHRNELIFFIMLVLISSLYFFLISRHLIQELKEYEDEYE